MNKEDIISKLPFTMEEGEALLSQMRQAALTVKNLDDRYFKVRESITGQFRSVYISDRESLNGYCRDRAFLTTVIISTMLNISTNIPYDATVLLAEISARHGDDCTVAQVVDYLCNKYLSNASMESLKAMLCNVENILPWKDNVPNARSLVLGRKIKFNVHCFDRIFPERLYLSHTAMEPVKALECLSQIACLGIKPEDAKATVFYPALNGATNWDRLMVNHAGVVSIKGHKKGGIELEMEDTGKAYQLAELLYQAYAVKQAKRDAA